MTEKQHLFWGKNRFNLADDIRGIFLSEYWSILKGIRQ